MRKYFLLTCFIILGILINHSEAHAFDDGDYNFKTARLSQNINRENFLSEFLKVKFLLENVQKKVFEHSKLFKNTNYVQAKEDVSNAKRFLYDSEASFSFDNIDKAREYLKNALNKLEEAQFNIMPSRVVEARGMYLDTDSIPRTKKEITSLITKLKNANFNVIYPEVFRRGYTIVPSSFTEIDPDFKDANFDILGYLVEEAHYNNIEVHPWIWSFRVKSSTFGNPLLSRYPDYAARAGFPHPRNDEPLFLSPAEPKARELIANILKEIGLNYNIDGVLLDYIRYDETLGDDILSKKYFRKYYYDKHGEYPPDFIRKDDIIYVEWQLWRERQVASAVQQIRNELKKINSRVKIGVAVFRGDDGRLLKMQDWRNWASNGLVDYVCPMLYTDQVEDLNKWIDSETDNNSRNDYLYPTLGAHKFGLSLDMFKQIGLINKRHIPGINIFALSHFRDSYFDELVKGPFSKPAILPHKNINSSIRYILSDMTKWLNTLIFNEENLSISSLKEIKYKIENIIGNMSKSERSISNSNLFNEIQDLKLSLIKYKNILPKSFLDEMNHSLEYSKRLLIIDQQQKTNLKTETAQTIPPFPVMNIAKKIPIQNISRTSIPVTLDGNLENSFWSKHLPLRSFYWHNGIVRSEVETVVRLTYGTDNLYISFENYEPKMNNIQSNSFDRDSWDIFKDDSVEIFLQPDGRSDYYHFVVNLNNNKFDERIKDETWDSSFESSVKKDSNKWVVEVVIPFSDIGFSPAKGKILKANFVRNRPQELNPYSNWSPALGSTHNPSRFGSIILN